MVGDTLRLGIVVGVFLIAIVVAMRLNVDQKRRSLPGWLSWGVLVAAFAPVIAQELGYMPTLLGGEGIAPAVVLAFGFYIALPLLLWEFVPSPSRSPESVPSASDVVGAHVRPTSDSYAAGTYRIVGGGDDVVLLRVTDAAGHRIHSGAPTRVSATEFDEEFESTTNPDINPGFTRRLENQVQGLYWSIRRFF